MSEAERKMLCKGLVVNVDGKRIGALNVVDYYKRGHALQVIDNDDLFDSLLERVPSLPVFVKTGSSQIHLTLAIQLDSTLYIRRRTAKLSWLFGFRGCATVLSANISYLVEKLLSLVGVTENREEGVEEEAKNPTAINHERELDSTLEDESSSTTSAETESGDQDDSPGVLSVSDAPNMSQNATPSLEESGGDQDDGPGVLSVSYATNMSQNATPSHEESGGVARSGEEGGNIPSELRAWLQMIEEVSGVGPQRATTPETTASSDEIYESESDSEVDSDEEVRIVKELSKHDNVFSAEDQVGLAIQQSLATSFEEQLLRALRLSQEESYNQPRSCVTEGVVERERESVLLFDSDTDSDSDGVHVLSVGYTDRRARTILVGEASPSSGQETSTQTCTAVVEYDWSRNQTVAGRLNSIKQRVRKIEKALAWPRLLTRYHSSSDHTVDKHLAGIMREAEEVLSHLQSCGQEETHQRFVSGRGEGQEVEMVPVVFGPLPDVIGLRKETQELQRLLYFNVKNNKPTLALLLGTPGLGKTFLCQKVAQASNYSVLTLNGSQLFDKYLGNSEKRLADFIAQAEGCAPVLIILDECDSFFCSRQSGESETVRRVKLMLLQFLNDENVPGIVGVMTTNRPQDLDSAMVSRLSTTIHFKHPSVEEMFEALRFHCQELGADLNLTLEQFKTLDTELLSFRDIYNIAKRSQDLGPNARFCNADHYCNIGTKENPAIVACNCSQKDCFGRLSGGFEEYPAENIIRTPVRFTDVKEAVDRTVVGTTKEEIQLVEDWVGGKRKIEKGPSDGRSYVDMGQCLGGFCLFVIIIAFFAAAIWFFGRATDKQQYDYDRKYHG